MVRIHRTLKAVALALAMIAQPVAGQSFASLTHTVSVTVPPRVKVQVGSVALTSTTIANTALRQSTQGISLSINATRAWVLSVGAALVPSASSMKWSRDPSAGFTTLATSDVTVASGAFSNEAASAEIFFRSAEGAAIGAKADAVQAPVVLTVAAP
jgi:hypothetical protein